MVTCSCTLTTTCSLVFSPHRDVTMSKWIASKKRTVRNRGGGLASNVQALYATDPHFQQNGDTLHDGSPLPSLDGLTSLADHGNSSVSHNQQVGTSSSAAQRARSRDSSVASDDIDERVAHPIPKKRRTRPPVANGVETSVNGKVSSVAPTKKPSAKARGKAAAKSQNAGGHFIATVEWPEHFKHLQKTFNALNTVYTFLSTRRHLASTFENLKSSVESILKRCGDIFLLLIAATHPLILPSAHSRFMTLLKSNRSSRRSLNSHT